jgi:hypothetical protein
VKCGTPCSFPLGMPFRSIISCSAILWQREKKGNGTFVLSSVLMIADQTRHWLTNFHEIFTKRRKLLTANDVTPSHALAMLALRRTARDVREDLVKVREVRKRPICYHSLRKALAPRPAQNKKRGRRIYPGSPAYIRSCLLKR